MNDLTAPCDNTGESADIKSVKGGGHRRARIVRFHLYKVQVQARLEKSGEW